jgi:hypothetical protein
MNASSINSSPAMQLVNAQLSGEVAQTNIANAVAVKQAKISKDVAQAVIQLLDAATEISSGQDPSRGIDVKA